MWNTNSPFAARPLTNFCHIFGSHFLAFATVLAGRTDEPVISGIDAEPEAAPDAAP